MNDAWQQLDDLLALYTQTTKVRPDIEVVGRACHRGVELIIWELQDPADPLRMRSYRSTGKRNVSTMRELAKALNDACDFVEQLNPEWAERAKRL